MIAKKLRRALSVNPAMMKIATAQYVSQRRRPDTSSFPVPISLGTTAYAENVRRFGEELRPVGSPQTVLQTADKPSFCDSRGLYTHIFTISEGGMLRHAATLQPDGEAKSVGTDLAALPSAVVSAHAAGSFTILMLEDGTIHYLDYNSERMTYRWLGALPEMPSFEARAQAQPDSVASIAPYDFGRTVADFRQNIDEKIAGELARRFAKALNEAEESAASKGLRTAPCAVRIGLRLWDGRLIYISAPKIVGAGINAGTWSGVQYPLAMSSNGFTGTLGAQVSVDTYRLNVRGMAADASAVLPQAWLSLVRQIEVWVADMPAIAQTTDDYSIFHNSENGAYTLEVRMGRPDSSRIVEELVHRPMRLLGVLPAEGVAWTDIYRNDAEPALYPAATTSPFAPVKAKAAAAHDGFLHLANISRRLPAPTIPDTTGTATGFYPCCVEVEINTRRGRRTVAASGVLPSLSLEPLLWYPDSRADMMRIRYHDLSDGKWRSAEFPLSPMTTENAACYASPSGSPIAVASLSGAGEAPATTEAVELWEESPEEIVSCHRGNPFAIADSIGSAGDSVYALAPQTIGGGAFTRQYLYVFTRNGISALNHDMNGRYTNLRSLSAAKVTSPTACVASPRGLYVLTDGQLLVIRDSQVTHLLRGLEEYTRLLWHDRFGELWLLPPEEHESYAKALALDAGSFDTVGVEGSMRTVVPGRLLRAGGTPLFFGRYAIQWRIFELEGKDSQPQTCKWVSATLPISFGGVGLLRARIGGWKDTSFSMKMVARTPFVSPGEAGLAADTERSGVDDILLTGATAAHPSAGRLSLPFAVPARAIHGSDDPSFYLRAYGSIRYLRNITLLASELNHKR